MGKIIAFYFSLHNACRTTTCVNLGACLAKRGKKILVVDMDPQHHASYQLATSDEKITIIDVLRGQVEPNVAIKATQMENLFILPSNLDLIEFESEPKPIKDCNILSNALEKIRDLYDYIFIDCSPAMALNTFNALSAADSIIIPVDEWWFYKELVADLLHAIKIIQKQYNPQYKIEGIVMGCGDNCAIVETKLTELTELFGDKIYSTRIPLGKDFDKAIKAQKPLCLYKPKCKAAKAYRELVAEFLERNK